VRTRRGATRQRRARRRGRAISPEVQPTFVRVEALLRACSPGLRKWLVLNLALCTLAMLQLWRGARSGHGALTLAAVSRALPLEEREKVRSKRLARLLGNKHLVGSALTPLLVRLALGRRPRGPVPIVLDQTTLRGTPTLLAGVRVAGRILPVAFACFEYKTLRKSQNALEWALLFLVTASLPPGCTPLFVLDRGYARAKLLAQCRQAGIPFLVRGRRNTMVRLGGQRLALGRVPYRQGVAIRYPHVLYQDTIREAVDLIIFHDPTFKEPWFLLVPPGSSRQWPTARVVALYRQRMHIELTFRDWKTHLGVRGLRLEVDIAPRLERLLLALTVAYTLAVLLGAGPAARRVRADCEILRTTPRHGTRRRLSALSVGILLLALTRFAALAARTLTRLLAALARGTPAATLAVCPP